MTPNKPKRKVLFTGGAAYSPLTLNAYVGAMQQKGSNCSSIQAPDSIIVTGHDVTVYQLSPLPLQDEDDKILARLRAANPSAKVIGLTTHRGGSAARGNERSDFEETRRDLYGLLDHLVSMVDTPAREFPNLVEALLK